MSFLSGGVAVVTGAGSGIGRALAQQLAAEGSALALADIDEEGLQQTAQSLAKNSALVTTHAVDVAKEEAVKSFAGQVQERHGRVTLLINNAGVSLHGNFEEISLDDGYQFLGHGLRSEVFSADAETRTAGAHREPFECVWTHRPRRTDSLC